MKFSGYVVIQNNYLGLNKLFHGLQGMRGVVSVSNITENEWMDFHEIFIIGRLWHEEQSGAFGGVA